MMYFNHTRKHLSRGFTLVELIVSTGLFLVVVTISMSAYLALISLDRKARATSDVVTNLSYVLDSMGRTIRTGTGYECGIGGGDCWDVNGGTRLSFRDENGIQQTYLLKDDGTVGLCSGSVGCTSTSASQITDSRILITNLRFYVEGTESSALQPRVVYTITGSITPDENSDPITFTIQSSATQRLIDI